MKLKLPYHGPDHLPGGPDSIPRLILFDATPQVGQWLDLATTGFGGAFGVGIGLGALDGGVQIQSDNTAPGSGFLQLTSKGEANNGLNLDARDINNAGINNNVRDDGNGGWNVDVRGASSGGASITVHDSGDFNLSQNGSGQFNLVSPNGTITVDAQRIFIADNGTGSGLDSISLRIADTNTFLIANLTSVAELFVVYAAGNIAMPELPTSTAGLGSGQLWRNGTVVNIIP